MAFARRFLIEQVAAGATVSTSLGLADTQYAHAGAAATQFVAPLLQSFAPFKNKKVTGDLPVTLSSFAEES